MDALKQRSDRRSSLTKPLPYPTTKKPKGKESKGPFRKKGKGGDHQAAGQQPQHRSTVPSAPVPSSSSSQPVRGGEKIRKIMHAAANPLLKPPAGARPSQKMGELPSFLPLDSSSIIKPASPPSGNDDKMLLAAQSPSKDVTLKQREALKRKISPHHSPSQKRFHSGSRMHVGMSVAHRLGKKGRVQSYSPIPAAAQLQRMKLNRDSPTSGNRQSHPVPILPRPPPTSSAAAAASDPRSSKRLPVSSTVAPSAPPYPPHYCFPSPVTTGGYPFPPPHPEHLFRPSSSPVTMPSSYPLPSPSLLFHPSTAPPHPVPQRPHVTLPPSIPPPVSQRPHVTMPPSIPPPVPQRPHVTMPPSIPPPVPQRPHVTLPPSIPPPVSQRPHVTMPPSIPPPVPQRSHVTLPPSIHPPVSQRPHVTMPPSIPPPVSQRPHVTMLPFLPQPPTGIRPLYLPSPSVKQQPLPDATTQLSMFSQSVASLLSEGSIYTNAPSDHRRSATTVSSPPLSTSGCNSDYEQRDMDISECSETETAPTEIPQPTGLPTSSYLRPTTLLCSTASQTVSSGSQTSTYSQPITSASVIVSPAITPASVIVSPAITPASVIVSPAITPASVIVSPAITPTSQLSSPAITPASVTVSSSITSASVIVSPAITPTSQLSSPAITPTSVTVSSSIAPMCVHNSSTVKCSAVSSKVAAMSSPSQARRPSSPLLSNRKASLPVKKAKRSLSYSEGTDSRPHSVNSPLVSHLPTNNPSPPPPPKIPSPEAMSPQDQCQFLYKTGTQCLKSVQDGTR